MATLLDWVGEKSGAPSRSASSIDASGKFKVSQQVVVSQKTRIGGPMTRELRVGTIQAFSPDGESATVSMPAPGGRVTRMEVPVAQLQPVTDRFKRASVQFNPAFRNIAGHRV